MGESKFKTYSVTDFLGWLRADELALSPSFQRRSVWSPPAKSLLVDSIVRGIPVPMIFLRELPADLRTLKSRREVVDGQQRLRTVFSFVSPDLVKGFNHEHDAFTVRRSHNKAIANTPFPELDEQYQRTILEYEFSVYIFPSSTSDQEVLQIFARLNSTGLKLNYQELRNAEFFGEFKTLAYELAAEQLERWRAWRVFSEAEIARMQEVELMSELMQTVLQGVTAKSKASLDGLYRRYDETLPDAAVLTDRCARTMDFLDERLGKDLRNLPSGHKTLTYAAFCAGYDLLYGLGSELEPQTPASVPLERVRAMSGALQDIASDSAPENVLEATARRTTHRAERSTLVDYLLSK